ncbi:hypothetical protein GCM10014715_36690 [Streptomyces spiralis]|uniref:Uncharacterized protein n=1 Tax=Streptomyces spiralis TaxID=66376 RepID=A0A918ZZN3_9ACTN|nr:hypothetical protein GCM10014715_36690 [Streptomyces spiralis]
MLQALLARRGGDDVVPVVTQGELNTPSHRGVVFDEQDPGHVDQYVRAMDGRGCQVPPGGRTVTKGSYEVPCPTTGAPPL